MIEAVDFAICAIFTKRREDFGLRIGNLPTWPLGMRISRTFLTDVFRATHYLLADIFVFPEI